MDILLEIRPWRLSYALLDPWSHGNITRENTMASFVRLNRFLVLWRYYQREDHGVFCMPYLIPGLMEILIERRSWRLLYVLLDHWSYGNITRDKTLASFVRLKRFLVFGNITREKTMASFVCTTWFLVSWKYYQREYHGVFCMHNLVPGLMEILLERIPWRLLYVLIGSWSYGDITREKIMASFVCPT